MLFDNKNVLENNIDKPTTIMGSKLTSHSNNQSKLLNCEIYQGKWRCQRRNNHYDRGRQQGRNISSSGDRLR